MKTTQMIIAPLLAIAMGATAGAQGDKKKTGPKGIGGLLTAGRQPTSAPERPAAQPAATAKVPETVKVKPAAAALRKRIAELEAVRYSEIGDVSKSKAEARLKRLRARHAALSAMLPVRAPKFVAKLHADLAAADKRWTPIADAIADGKPRSDAEWRALLDGKAPAKAEKAEKAPGEEAKPVDEKRRLELFAEMVKGRKLPAGMKPETWAKLLDAHSADRARLEAAAHRAQAYRERELARSSEALARAESTLEQIISDGHAPADYVRRQLNWRLHQAELEQMRGFLAGLEAIDANVGLHPRYQSEQILDPLHPSAALQYVANAIKFRDAAQAPGPDAFDGLDDGRLVNQINEEFRHPLENDSYLRNMTGVAVDRYRGRLRAIDDALQSTAAVIDREDQRAIEGKRFQLELAADIAGKGHDRVDQAKRAAALMEFQAELAKTSDARIAARTAELQKHRAVVLAQLQKFQTQLATLTPKPEFEGYPE